jgi:signal transduction histidine kinase
MRPQTAGKLGWTTLALAVVTAGIGMTLTVLQGSAATIAENAFLLVAFVSLGAVGALVVSRMPRNAVGWLFLSCAGLAAVTFLSDQFARWTLVTHPGHLPGGRWAAWVSNWSWLLFFIPFLIFVPLLFPDGHLASRRWRPVAWVAAVALGMALLSIAFQPGKLGDNSFDVANPVGVERAKALLSVVSAVALLVLLVCLILAVISLVQRYRRAAGEERARFNWFVYGVSVLIGSFLLNIGLGIFFGDAAWTNVAFDLGIVAVPIGAGIAILRHRLYDIDVVINRTIVVGALAVFVTVVYAALVVGIGAAVVGSRSNTFLTLLAAVVIAVAFQPVRTRAQHFANRLVFGKRATPYEVLSEFADRVGRGYGGDDLLQQMAKTVGEGVGGSAAYVWLRVGSELQAAGTWPNGAPELPTVPVAGAEVPPIPGAHGVYPVRHEGELLGALSVSTSRGERMSQTEDRLVADLAAQAGLVLRNVRLIEELRASRQRIVSASDAERRRLERNIHDGAQQLLVALAMKLRLAKGLARRDLDRAEALFEDVQQDAQDALDTLRDLARGIYPPLLADEGLAAALSAQARRAAIPVTVQVDGIGRYPQDVEAAAYFCCLEAMQNAAKYGAGAPVTISLGDAAGLLTFRVADRGPGFDPAHTKPGSGLQNMQDRLEALGGSLEIDARPSEGTVVLGRIPIRSG